MQEEFNSIHDGIQVDLANIVDNPGVICCLLTLMSLFSLQQPAFLSCHMDKTGLLSLPLRDMFSGGNGKLLSHFQGDLIYSCKCY